MRLKNYQLQGCQGKEINFNLGTKRVNGIKKSNY